MSNRLPAEDPLIRMQRDLKRALAKKPSDIKWGMVIDIARCIGCHACTIGCVAENKLPPGVVYRPLSSRKSGNTPMSGAASCPVPASNARTRPA